MSGPARLRVHIGTLVVEGVGGLSREALADALRRELGQRLAGDGAAARILAPGHRERVDGGSFELRPGAGSRAVGRHIAAAVERGLGAP